jgi:cell division protein ZapA
MKSTKGELFVKDEQKNKITVEIYGQKYRLMGKVSTEHLQMVAQFVNQKMNDIAGKSPSLDTAKISVLSAVNIADEYFKLKKEHEELLCMLDEKTKE